MNKEKQINAMVEFIDVVVSVSCTKCDAATSDWGIDDLDAAKEFYQKGWRVTSKNCYCPKCAKKYLKP